MTKFFTGVLFFLSTAAFAQSTTWTPRNREKPKMLSADSALIAPKMNVLYSGFNNIDSTGSLFYFTPANKFYGKFAGVIAKPLASEDSVQSRWDSTKVKSYIFSAGKPTLDTVLKNADSSGRNIVFSDTSKLFWRSKTSDYAYIQFYSTGDLNNTSNLVFTMGDNPYYPLQTLEGFIFRKDTNSTVGVGVKYDTIINANDAFVRFSKKDNLANPLLMVNRLTNRVGVNLPDPTSTLFVNGSIGFTRRTITATTTLDDMDHFVLCNNASPIVVNLPSAPAAVGREYTITKINAVTASITITPSGGAQINGTTTVVINSAYTSQTIFSDGANWWVR